MNKYSGLLSAVSQQYHFYKGKHETEDEWKMRLIYSICGMMAYASLWDNSEESISIVHLKKRVNETLVHYKSMYPELAGKWTLHVEEFEDEIVNQFLNTGVAYHSPNRLAPSMKHEESFGNILFQRGIALDDITHVSGIGFYSKQGGSTSSDGVKVMFDLEQEDLKSLWHTTLSSASWKSALSLFEQKVEYLRLKPPFTHGYWVNAPDTTGAVSILRTGIRGSQLYYLYRYSGTMLEVSSLPQWKVESYNYRTLASACLLTYGTLPPIDYFENGAIVHIHMNYLLPPRELEFLKLYSWPEECTFFPYNFKRKLSTDVFEVIRNILFDEGYEFKEGVI